MTIKFSTEVKTAILVTMAIALFIWGFNFLKGTNLFSIKYEYYAIYDNVEGIIENSPVLINGYSIGQVREVRFLQEKFGRVLVKIVLFENIRIPRNSIAKIYSYDLLGSKAIDLILGKDSQYAAFGDTILGKTELSLQEEVNRQVIPLKRKAEELILSIDSVMTVIQTILNKGARENLTKSFESIKRAIENFENTSIKLDELVESEKGRLHNIFTNIESITGNIQNHNKALATAIDNISAISDTIARARLASTLINTDQAMRDFSTILNKINNGEGSMGMLVNNDSLFLGLSKAATDIDALVKDLQAHPGRYLHFSIFGKKEKVK